MINDSSSLRQTRIKSQTTMDFQSLIDMCTKKLEEDPLHKKALLLRASSLIKKGDLNVALKDGMKLIDIDAKNSATFFMIGCIYEKMGNVSILNLNFIE